MADDKKFADAVVGDQTPMPIVLTERAIAIASTADQSVTNSTTLVSHTALLAALLANRRYDFELKLLVDATVAGNGIKVAMIGPASPTNVFYHATLQDATGVNDIAAPTEGVAVALATALNFALDITAKAVVIIKGTILNGANAGNLQLQFAQQTAGAAELSTVESASSLKVTELPN